MKDKIKTMQLVLAISVLLTGIKFFAYYITHSNSILTDALESIVNLLTGAFALFSLYYASKPKDEDHPYGHGKIEHLSAGFEGGMIVLAGSAMIYEGINALIKKPEIHEADKGIYLTVIAGAVNLFLGRYLVRKGKKEHSPALQGEGKHLMSDAWSSVAIVVSLTLVYFTKWYYVDYIVSILMGIYILLEGFKTLRDSVNDLLDKADFEKINHLIDLLNKNRKTEWIDVHNLRVLKYGETLHVDCHITLPWYQSLEESHTQVDSVEQLIKKDFDRDIEFFIHADPCVPPTSCSVCQITDCKQRQSAFQKKIEWNIDNLLPDTKHKA